MKGVPGVGVSPGMLQEGWSPSCHTALGAGRAVLAPKHSNCHRGGHVLVPCPGVGSSWVFLAQGPQSQGWTPHKEGPHVHWAVCDCPCVEGVRAWERPGCSTTNTQETRPKGRGLALPVLVTSSLSEGHHQAHIHGNQEMKSVHGS